MDTFKYCTVHFDVQLYVVLHSSVEVTPVVNTKIYMEPGFDLRNNFCTNFNIIVSRIYNTL